MNSCFPTRCIPKIPQISCLIVTMLVTAFFVRGDFAVAQEKSADREKRLASLLQGLNQWKENVAVKLDDKERKHPLVALMNEACSKERGFYDAFSFAAKSNANDLEAGLEYDFAFEGEAQEVKVNLIVGQQHFVVELEKADFDADINIRGIPITTAKIFTASFTPRVGAVYLFRSHYPLYKTPTQYFLMKFVANDPQSRYLAFLWRELEIKKR